MNNTDIAWGTFILLVLMVLAVAILPAYPQSFVPSPKPLVAPIKPKPYFIFPPAHYDRYYEGDLTIKIVNNLEDLYAACDIRNEPRLLACSMHTSTACLIIMVRDEIMRARGSTTGLLLRHEIGHCNGWGGDHAGERAITAPSPHFVSEDQRPVARNIIRNPWN